MGLAGITNYLKPTVIVDANFDNSTMTNEEFLKVLLADLQWQDPLNANDITEFIDNTIKLREMEVLNSFQQTVDLLKEVSSTNSLLYAATLIDQTVYYEGNSTYVKDGSSTVKFKLEDDADTVRITVIDSEGNIVDQQTFQFLDGGIEYPFEINNPDLPDGYYTIFVEAEKGGEPVVATVISEGLVESVLKTPDGIKLVINNNEVDLNSIVQIGG
ncbi:MAG: flagellar hook capping protein [Aquificae bacterium]|nr:flagellar hook capping protein [Aquificota bacterium]